MENKDNKLNVDKDKILKKWSSILDDADIPEEKKGWMSQYAEMHKINENNNIINETMQPGDEKEGEGDFSDFNLLPVAMKVAAKTIGQDLVSVNPMDPTGIPDDELERVKVRIKKENRQAKIDSVVDEKEFVEKQLEDDKEYKKLADKYGLPKGNIFYLDYRYGDEGEEE
jgi:hypothetical protein